MKYAIRSAVLADVPHLVAHRERMFRDMGVSCDYEAMATSFRHWLEHALPAETYRGWLACVEGGAVVAGGGLIVMPWPAGPLVFDPRIAFVFNVYTDPAHRRHGLARRVVDTMHAWCRTQGIERVALNASDAGLPIYQSMGYVITPEPMMRLTL